MNLKSCIESGSIKKDESTKEFINSSIKNSEQFLESCNANINIKDYRMAFRSGYLSIFHTARALLYYKGYKEHSHICLFA